MRYRFIALLILALCTVSCSGPFRYQPKGDGVVITGLNQTDVSGHFVIPETLDGYPVRGLSRAFENYRDLTGHP